MDRILVADDEPVMRELLQELLESKGYQVRAVPGGREAIDEACRGDYLLVLTDLSMPGVSGLDVVAAVRARRPELPVAIATGFASLETAVQAIRLGAFDYILKPLRWEDLEATILRVKGLALAPAGPRAPAPDPVTSLGVVAGQLAHEIRNPLSAILTSAQLLGERLDEADARRDYVRIIVQEAGRLEALLQDLREFSRPASPPRAPEALNELVARVVLALQDEARRAGVRVRRRLDAKIPAAILDGAAVERALRQLARNGLQAMPGGGELTLSTRFREGLLSVEVTDSGVGIRPEDQARIFEPFFSTKPRAAGLGLTYSLRIAREHAGEIRVDSRPGHGSSFTFVLPWQRPPEPNGRTVFPRDEHRPGR
jgi:signal transduction histidine kinase